MAYGTVEPKLWDAVAELESKGFTKEEICDMLDEIWLDLYREHAVPNEADELAEELNG